MGLFNTKAILNGDPAMISKVADRICREFHEDGYEGFRDHLANGSVDISLTKGSFFKSVLGMDTALKIKLTPQDDAIAFDAGVGVFGKEVIPTVVSLFFLWPVLVTQIWGLVKQSKLDDRALEIANEFIAANKTEKRSAPYVCIINEALPPDEQRGKGTQV